MKIGARTFKTGLAVALALLIPPLLGMPEGSILAGISAVFAMQPSPKRQWVQVRNRILGNTIGGIVAVIFTLSFGSHYLIVGFASAILIAILHQLNFDNVIGNAVVTLIVISFTTADSFVLAAGIRILATIMGVIIGTIVNTFLYRPKYEDKLFHLMDYTSSELMKWIRASVRKNTQFTLLKKDLKFIQSEIKRMDNYLSMMKEDNILTKSRIKQIRNLRRIAVYRQLVETTRAAYNLASTLHSAENVFNHFSSDLRILIRERLEVLLSGHEQILLKFNGRVDPEAVNFIAYKSSLRKEFMSTFFDEAKLDSYMHDDYGDSNAVIHIMSAILEYEENLILLNRLVTSYRHYDWSQKEAIDNIQNIEQ
ncbi:FUSC family protein [Desemzia incerta]|uniref:FUSC family protein n=1 Tax=Desemzia incerta TaxID=82801 RepID=UPI0016616AB3|nr:aromatic acid exporter family protein [Desemzia incerta]